MSLRHAAAPCVERIQQDWRALFERGAAVWPGVKLEYEEFVRHINSLGAADAPSHAADLYLAAACTLGRGPAHELLDQQYVQCLRRVVLGVVGAPYDIDDVLQDLRKRLLVGPAPKIARYRGVGMLKSWIRAIAVNIARDRMRSDASRRRREERQLSLMVLSLSQAWAEDDDSAGGMQRDGVCVFKRALDHSLGALDVQERRLLYDYFVRGLSIDVLAPLCGVNRATVARRIGRLTCLIRKEVRTFLACSYPREDRHMLDAIALAAAGDASVDPLLCFAPLTACRAEPPNERARRAQPKPEPRGD